MDLATPLPCTGFATAKTRLSEMMTEVVHRHHPQLVGRHGGKEKMLLMGLDDLSAVLEPFHFSPQVSVVDGGYVVRLPELNLIASGASFDEAISSLIDVIEDYSEVFLPRLDFYMQTDRRQHLPWLLRFTVTPPEQRAALLVQPPVEARGLAAQVA